MQSKASGASALVLLMLLVFVLWVLFLPPSARNELLASNTTPASSNPGLQFNKILVSQAVGSLLPEGPPVINHPLPSMFLFESKQAQIIASNPVFTIKHSLFSNTDKVVSFSLDSKNDIIQLSAVFRASVHQGILSISLNDVTIFTDALNTESISPITLPKGLLKEQNTLSFSVSGVGAKFWHTNEYRIENLQIIADTQDKTRQQSIMSFALDSAEFNNLRATTLSFMADCEQKTAGTLTITLNSKKVYEAIPDCGAINKQEILGADLQSGRNEIVVSLSKGNIRVEQAKIQTSLKPTQSSLAFFQVSDLLLEEVQSRSSHIVLKVLFVDDGTQKSGITNVNGRLDSFDQKTGLLSRDISSIIRAGNNYVELVPRTPLHVVSVDVRVE
ncbi:MAG: hypothetical protein Q7K43_02530 [Candidatus Woesearchaeota archaeon]|nr:hypothetical protein [Candidatus Woesearchaeota archaeon]